MTKKTTFLITVLFIFISVMIMAIFGAETGYVGMINVDKITFFDQNGKEVTEKVTDKDGNLSHFFVIKNTYDESIKEYSYTYGVQLTPNNCTDKRLAFTVNKTDLLSFKITEVQSNLGDVNKTIEFEDDPSYSVVKYTLNITKTVNSDDKTELPVFYYISIVFTEQEGVDFNFDFNLSGVIKKTNLRFAWEGTKHSQDIDV